ncbi:MAG TPA: hypothetical protein VMV44_06870 [Rectinemataceae bacterium]|nr:hypothetical protein [Rectinemataceae bacterium]
MVTAVELLSYLSQSSIALFRSSLEYTDNLLTTIHVQDFVRTPFRQFTIGADKQERKAESAEILRLRREISRLSSFKATLDRELERDGEAARDRDALLAKGELSPSDALDAQAESLRFQSEVAGIIWRLISAQARLALLEGADPATSFEER